MQHLRRSRVCLFVLPLDLELDVCAAILHVLDLRLGSWVICQLIQSKIAAVFYDVDWAVLCNTTMHSQSLVWDYDFCEIGFLLDQGVLHYLHSISLYFSSLGQSPWIALFHSHKCNAHKLYCSSIIPRQLICFLWQEACALLDLFVFVSLLFHFHCKHSGWQN